MMIEVAVSMNCPLTKEEQAEEHADLLLPLSFVPTTLGHAVKLTGKAKLALPTIRFGYVHFLENLQTPVWSLYFWGDDLEDLAHFVGAEAVQRMQGWMFERPQWSAFTSVLRTTPFDPWVAQWEPRLPADQESRYAPAGLECYPDLYVSRVARAWRDLYGVVSQDGPVDVAMQRPVWYNEQRPAWVRMEGMTR